MCVWRAYIHYIWIAGQGVCFVFIIPQAWPAAVTLLSFLSSQTQNVHSKDSTIQT